MSAIVITGAAGGIGSALARAMATYDHKLTLADVAGLVLPATAAAACYSRADVTCPKQMRGVAADTVRSYGCIDIWFHCAGKGQNRRALDLDEADLMRMMQINAWGTLNAVQAVMPHFRRQRHGTFLAVSSALTEDIAWRSPHRSAYAASKLAMEALLLAVRQDVREIPTIRFEFLRLPGVDTDFARNADYFEPGAVSSSPKLLSAEEAADLLIAASDDLVMAAA